MTAWPVKEREVVNVHMDSRVWNAFDFHDGDIVIGSWGKSGCTWLQQLVAQLVSPAEECGPLAEVSPWLELALQNSAAVLERLERQDGRRIIKTHLPVDALVYSPKAKYLYIGRDGRDVAWSLFNHLRRLKPLWYDVIGGRAQLDDEPADLPTDFSAFFLRWLRDDGFPFWPFWTNVRSWWEVRELPNIRLIHFRELKADLRETAERVAGFLDAPIDPRRWPKICERCSFSYMKDNAAKLVSHGDVIFDGGAEKFFHKGESGGWRAALRETDVREYLDARAALLPPDCARWLDGEVD